MKPELLAITSVVANVLLGGGGLIVWFRLRPELGKMRADTRKAAVESTVLADSAEDAHWQAIIKAQAESLVEPLRREVGELRHAVDELRKEVETHRTRYWRAVTYIRVLLAWARHPSTSDVPPPPAELAVDI